MQQFTKLLLFHTLLFFGVSTSYAQTDTEFWFAVPEITKDHNDSDKSPFLRFTNTTNQKATITITMPAHPYNSVTGKGFKEKQITLNGNETKSFNLYGYRTNIQIPQAPYDVENDIFAYENHYREDLDIKGKNNRGILIKATQPITCYYEPAHAYNSDIFVLKGNNGLGSEFYTPFQTIYCNQSVNWNRPAYSCFIVTFTEDDTYMTLTIPYGKKLMDGTTGTITLGPFQKGETFVGAPHHNTTNANHDLKNNKNIKESGTNFQFGRTGADHLSGVHIQTHDESNLYQKFVTVIISDDSMLGINGGSYDIGGDQIVPVTAIGTEYMVIKGKLSSIYNHSQYKNWPTNALPILDGNKFDQETCYIVATKANTEVTITPKGGTVKTITLNAGDTYAYSLHKAAIHIKASDDHPVYVWQVTGKGAEMGAAILPSIDRCTGSKKIIFSAAVANHWERYLNIIVKDGINHNVKLNGNSITIPNGNKLKGYRYYNGKPGVVTGAVSTLTNNNLMHMALYMGDNAGARMGFFSGFSSAPIIEKVTDAEGTDTGSCGKRIKLQGVTGDDGREYQWYKNNEPIQGETTYFYQVDYPGTYHAQVKETCNGSTLWSFASNKVDVLPCLDIYVSKKHQDKFDLDEVPEDVGKLKLDLKLNHKVNKEITFDYYTQSTASETATPDALEQADGSLIYQTPFDYKYKRKSVTIPANTQEVTIDIDIEDDEWYEGENHENFFVIFDNVVNVDILENQLEIKIHDNDPKPLLSFPLDAEVSEDQQSFDFKLKLSTASSEQIDVKYIFKDKNNNTSLTAEKIVNFKGTDGVYTFQPGEKEGTITFDIIDDNIYYPDGYATLKIELAYNKDSNNGFAYVKNNSNNEIKSAIVKITDLEAKPTLKIEDGVAVEGTWMTFSTKLSHPCAEEVSFTVNALDFTDAETSNHKAKKGTNYKWETNQKDTKIAIEAFKTAPNNTNLVKVETMNDNNDDQPPLYFKLTIANEKNCLFDKANKWVNGIVLDVNGKDFVSVLSTSVEEASGAKLRFPVRVVPENKEKITFQYTTVENGVSSNDFAVTSGKFEIPANTKNLLYIDVPVLDNCYYNSATRTLQLKVWDIKDNTKAMFEKETMLIDGTILEDEAEMVVKDDKIIIPRNETTSFDVAKNDLGLKDLSPSYTFDTSSLSSNFPSSAISTSGSTVTYTPDNSIPFGWYNISYEVKRCTDADVITTPSESAYSKGTVAIAITPPTNLYPVDDGYSVYRRIDGKMPLNAPTGTDPDPYVLSDDELTIFLNDTKTPATKLLIEENAKYGTLTITTDSMSISYTPNDYYYGPDHFTYRLKDGVKSGRAATVDIDVKYRNYFKPTAKDNTITIGKTAAGTPQKYLIDFNQYITDEDDGPKNEYSTLDLNGVEIPTNVTNGTLERIPGTFKYYYTPHNDYTGTDKLVYSIKDAVIDGDGGEKSDAATIVFTVKGETIPTIEAKNPVTVQINKYGKGELTKNDIFKTVDNDNEYYINGKLDKYEFTCSDVGTQYVKLEKKNTKTGLTAQLLDVPVTVEDNLAPTFLHTGLSVVDDPNYDTEQYWYTISGLDFATVAWSIPSATDQCYGEGVTVEEENNRINGGSYEQGTYPLKYTAKDKAGNVSDPYEFTFYVANELIVPSPTTNLSSHCAGDNLTFSSKVTGGYTTTTHHNIVKKDLTYEWYLFKDQSTSYKQVINPGTDPFNGLTNLKLSTDQTKGEIKNVDVGTHTLILQVTDGIGTVKGESVTFTVKPRPALTPFKAAVVSNP